MADMNFQNTGFKIPSDNTRIIKIDENVVKRTLKHIAAPVFDFFTKTEEPEETLQPVDYDKAIAETEMKAANIQKILNDSDPNARKTLNVVI